MNQQISTKWIWIALVISLTALCAINQISFALTPAGTVIGNSATATYRDTLNNEYTTTSNIVQTTVLEVCGVDVLPESGVTMNGIAGQTVYLVYQVQNTGNGENTFNLSISNQVGSPSATYLIYRDANQNGVVDPAENTAITQITLSMGATASVIVGVSLPAGAGAQYTFNLNATGTAPGSCTDFETGTVNVVNDALITATKAVDRATAVPDDLLTYTITFINNGTKAAKSHDGFTINGVTGMEGILVYDQIPAGSTFHPGSASGNPTVNPTGYPVYSGNGTTWFTTEAGVGGTITHVGYFMQDANPSNDVEEAVLAVNQQGTFIFKVRINLPFNDTDRSVDNMASVRYSNDGGTQQDVNTNEVHTTIPAAATADITNGPLPATNEDDEAPPRGNSADYTDDNLKKNVVAGSWVTFTHQVINDDLGNNDVINLRVDTDALETSLPTGYIVEFWNSDGSAKLIDTNNDGLVDVGTVTANGGTRTYTVKVFIPSSTPTEAQDGTIDYWVTILASSSNNPSEVDRSRDNIDGVVAASVDIARNGAAGDNKDNHPSDGNTDGTNDGDDILPAHTTPIDPGSTATYRIQVVNTGGSSDSFALTATTPVTPIPGGTIRLFEDSNCDGVGDTQITDTPLLGGTVLTQAASNTNFLVVQDVANFSVGDKVIVGLNGTLLTVDEVDVGSKTIKVSANVTASAGTLVSESYCVVMTVATLSSTPAGSYNIVVKATSGVSGAFNDMDVNLTVNEVCGVTLSPDGSDQVPPGGTTTYVHTVVNTGNSTRYVRISHTIASPQLSYLFVANGNNWRTVGTDGKAGTSDDGPPLADGDTAVIDTVYIQLAAGASAQFRIRVFAPSGVTPGTVESVTLKAEADKDGDFGTKTDQCIDDAVDTTTVIQGFLQLQKSQSVSDTDGPNTVTGVCGAGPDGIPTSTNPTEGGPCDEITYTVRYQNIGTQDAVRVVISDNIPNYTTYVSGSLVDDVNCNGTADAGEAKTDASSDDAAEYDSVNKLVRFRVGTGANASIGGTLSPGQQGCIIFKVKIQ